MSHQSRGNCTSRLIGLTPQNFSQGKRTLSRSLPSLNDPEEVEQDSCNETSLDHVMGDRDKATLLFENKNSGETFLSVKARKGRYEKPLSCNPGDRQDGQTQPDTDFKPARHVVSTPDMVIQPKESALEVPLSQDGEPQAESSRIPSLRERVAMYQAAITESSADKKLLPGMSSSSTVGAYQQVKQRFGFTKREGEYCKGCSEKVYWADRLAVDNNTYHKSCFRCHHCWNKLSLGNFAAAEGFVFCHPHFKQLFCVKGNYKDGFRLGEQALKGLGQEGQVYAPPRAHEGNVGGSRTNQT
uniref:LIM domain and actin-binding protein 1-like isoform X2 n=1 Tax=Myxine glutinosa TaxID=7769 RepID=UPI00358E6F82